MRQCRQTRRPWAGLQRRAFTLVELLTVMIIMMIVLGIALPAFQRLTGGTGVEAAARLVGSQLRLARQEAIAQRKRIAVLFPSGSQISDPADVGYVAVRACVVDRSGAFLEWVANTSWEYVPTGTVIAEVDQDPGVQVDGNNNPLDGTVIEVSGVPNSTGNVRAVIFKPTGSITASAEIYATVVEGMVLAEGGNAVVKNKSNYIDAAINQFTGRIAFQYPED